MRKLIKTPQIYDEWCCLKSEDYDPLLELRIAVSDIDSGRRKAAFIYGPPRIGKSHAIKQSLIDRTAGRNIIYSGAKNKAELLNALYKTKGKYPLVILEADKLIESDGVIELLKQAIDDSLPKRVKHQGETIRIDAPLVLEFTQNPSLFVQKTYNQLSSLFAISPLVQISSDRHMIAKYCAHDAIVQSLLGDDHYIMNNMQAAHDALDWFTTHVWKLKIVSPEMLKEIFDIFVHSDEHRDMRLSALLLNPLPVDAAHFLKADWYEILQERFSLLEDKQAA